METPEYLDTRQVLLAAQASLAHRDNLRLTYRVDSTSYLVSPATGMSPYKCVGTGTILLSAGRWRTEYRPEVPGKIGWTSLEVWNGSTYRWLSTHPDAPQRDRGSVGSTPHNPPVGLPLWLLTAKLGVMLTDRPDLSMFEHLLHHGTDLRAEVFREPSWMSNTSCACSAPREERLRALHSAPQFIRVTGKVAWGDYEVWLDPAKDYSMTRVVVNRGPIEQDAGTDRVETLAIVTAQVAGIGWVPVSSTLLETSVLPATQTDQLHDAVAADYREIQFSDITLVSADEPDASFDIVWPPGVRVDSLDPETRNSTQLADPVRQA